MLPPLQSRRLLLEGYRHGAPPAPDVIGSNFPRRHAALPEREGTGSTSQVMALSGRFGLPSGRSGATSDRWEMNANASAAVAKWRASERRLVNSTRPVG